MLTWGLKAMNKKNSEMENITVGASNSPGHEERIMVSSANHLFILQVQLFCSKFHCLNN